MISLLQIFEGWYIVFVLQTQQGSWICTPYAFTLYRTRYAVTALGTGFCVWRRRPGLIETFAMGSKHETQLLPVYPSNLADLSNDTITGITTTSDCCCYRIIFINYPHLSYTVIITFFSSIFFESHRYFCASFFRVISFPLLWLVVHLLITWSLLSS